MPPTTTTRPSPIPDLQQRCDSYRTDHHLPAILGPATRQILLPIEGIVAAITMPPALGQRVLAGLRVRMLAGPVIASTATHRWTFLTGPGDTHSANTLADLLRLDVTVCPIGEHIALPTPADEHIGTRHWANPPSHRDLPPQSTVIATTRAMAYRTGDQR